MAPGAINEDGFGSADHHAATMGHTSDPAKGSATSAPQPLDAYGEITPSATASTGQPAKLQHRPATVAAKKAAARRGAFASSSSPSSSASTVNSYGSGLDSASSHAEDNSATPPESYTPTSDHSFRIHQPLLVELFNWLHQERAKLAAVRKRKSATGNSTPDPSAAASTSEADSKRQCCHASEEDTEEVSLALDQLELILAQHSAATGPATAPAPGGTTTPTTTETGAGAGARTPSTTTTTTAATSGRRAVSSSSSTSTTPNPRRQSPAMKALRRGSTSDSDSADADRPVPSAADVVLDNSKTLLYSGGEADCDLPPISSAAAGNSAPVSSGVIAKEREPWLYFKSEIVRLTHTLGFKGWRRVPLEASGNVEVVRLSGALTNAVYVVSPPKNMPPATSRSGVPKKQAPKLLLRIYGPQVDHLIDRERELRILRRLAKKNIGPRVLGTFKNGRFEEYFYAQTLTHHDLRVPETSIQIAKRMRELHEGIELLPEERAGGPTIWENWDKWVGRCEQVITWLDNEITSAHNEEKAAAEPWRKRGYVCCVPWSQFRKTVDRLRKWLDELFGGAAGIRQKLVFAHNDTQYGNLLRLEPSGESPLLLPANEHKQLVVIDFEYSSANTKAFEFANHFTEWCYNYHDAEKPEACHAHWYPTIEEQERFIRAYLKHHRPSSGPNSGNNGTSASALQGTTYSSSPRIPPFILDSHVPSSTSLSGSAIADDNDRAFDSETTQLLRETRLWRVANSAQWVAWGIVQAKVSGLEEALAEMNKDTTATAAPTSVTASAPVADDSSTTDGEDSSTSTVEQTHNGTTETTSSNGNGNGTGTDPSSAQVIQEVAAEEVAEDFDYLAYAQERALFFWADIWELGLIKEEEFPAEMVEHVKMRSISR